MFMCPIQASSLASSGVIKREWINSAFVLLLSVPFESDAAAKHHRFPDASPLSNTI